MLNLRDKKFINKKIRNAYYCQGRRCNNPNFRDYRWYGALGVERKWTMREFERWYKKELRKREEWFDPVVTRFNDEGNYQLGNCSLKERKENRDEVKISYKVKYNGAKKVCIENVKTKERIIFNSSREGSREIGRNPSYLKIAIKEGLFVYWGDTKYKPYYIKDAA